MTTPRRALSRRRRRSLTGRIAIALLASVAAFYAFIVCCLVLLRWVAPFTTAVQTERRIDSWIRHTRYRKSYEFVPLDQISPDLQHAVIAAEDARFYKHHGFDWTEVQVAMKADLENGKRRGASTITQQLVKNLFLGDSRSFLRKGVEFTIVPLAEGLLSKQRILELYLNVIEWGPGIYGAQAASIRYYNEPARKITRAQAVGLAEVLPSPLRRKPGRLPAYGEQIQIRMSQLNW